MLILSFSRLFWGDFRASCLTMHGLRCMVTALSSDESVLPEDQWFPGRVGEPGKKDNPSFT